MLSGPPFEVDPISNDYVHPYWRELTQLKEGDLTDYFPAIPNPSPPPLEDTPLEFVNTVEALNKVIEELSSVSEIAVDLEVFLVKYKLSSHLEEQLSLCFLFF